MLVTEATCLVCDRPAKRGRRGPEGKYCSDECRRAFGALRIRLQTEARAVAAPSAECVVCGEPTKVFVSSGRAAKYCGDECRSRARNPGTWGPRKPRSPIECEPRVCEHCSKEFAPNAVKQKWCSEECSYAATRAARAKSIPSRECKGCGKNIETPHPSQYYCSSECRPQKYIKKKSVPVEHGCVHCGKKFNGPRNQKYCGRDCSLAFYRKRHRELYRHRDSTHGKCVHCGKEFEGRLGRKYCGSRCAKKANRKKSRLYKLKHGRKTDRERCQIWHRRYEPINNLKVFERDNWMCMICLAPVDRDTVAPDPLAASLDHRIPLSKGGHHTWDNVRCAHFGCNSIKSDKLDEEIKWPEADHPSPPQS